MAKRLKRNSEKFRTIMVYGEGGAGKTELIGHLSERGRVLLLTTEETRTESIEHQIDDGKIIAVPINGPKDFSEEFNRLASAKSGGQSVYEDEGEETDYSDIEFVAIDSVTRLTKMLLTVERAKNPKNKFEPFDKMADRTYKMLTALDKLPIHKVYTAHVETTNEDGVITKRMRFEGKKLRSLIGHALSIIVGLPKVTEESDRVFITQFTPEFPEAKDHSGKLGKTEPFDILALLDKSLGKTTQEEEKEEKEVL